VANILPRHRIASADFSQAAHVHALQSQEKSSPCQPMRLPHVLFSFGFLLTFAMALAVYCGKRPLAIIAHYAELGMNAA
jgi:hypothetical protein